MIFDALQGHGPVQLVFPGIIPGMADLLPLLRAESAEFEAVFGTGVVFRDADPGHGPRWIVEIDPSLPANELVWDERARVLTSRVRDSDGVLAAFNLLHSLVALGVDRITDAPERDPVAASRRVYREVGASFPGFGIRGLDWAEVTDRHILIDGSDMTFPRFERWIADLGDAHTAIRRPVPVYNPPYAVELTCYHATFRRVPRWSDAGLAGVGPGWALDLDDREGWLRRTGAPPHARRLVAGRRAIALDGVGERWFSAHGPYGERRTWFERAVPDTLDRLFEVRALDPHTAYMRIGNWITGIGLEAAIDEALHRVRSHDRLILDLQGNTGGNLVMATAFRDRFLRERTHLGSIHFTRGNGTLADPVDIWGEPPNGAPRWPNELVVLTDALTYSASEDFLLGLQGLPHVTVVGQRSGGGSGRARTLRILDGMLLTISTALTYDRNGVCIENHGIPVDIETAVFSDSGRNLALETAIDL